MPSKTLCLSSLLKMPAALRSQSNTPARTTEMGSFKKIKQPFSRSPTFLGRLVRIVGILTIVRIPFLWRSSTAGHHGSYLVKMRKLTQLIISRSCPPDSIYSSSLWYECYIIVTSHHFNAFTCISKLTGAPFTAHKSSCRPLVALHHLQYHYFHVLHHWILWNDSLRWYSDHLRTLRCRPLQ